MECSTSSVPTVVRVDVGDLEIVVSRLSRLHERGGVLPAEAVWFDDTELSGIEGGGESRPENVRAIGSSLRRAKRSLDILSSLTDSLKHTINVIKKPLLPILYDHGIYRLPDNVLAHIFELACDHGTKQHLNVSHVSPRFHKVTMHCPQLWTYLSPEHSLDWCRLQVKRSSSHGLIIDMSEHMNIGRTCHPFGDLSYTINRCSCVPFLAYVVKFHQRWQEFIFEIYHGGSDGVAGVQIQKMIGGLQLPLLRRLRFGTSTLYEQPEKKVIGTWIMPVLQSLSCKELDIQILNGLCGPLTSVAFAVTFIAAAVGEAEANRSTKTLVESLQHQSMKNVKHMKITVEDDTLRFARCGAPSNQKITLPALTSLTFDLSPLHRTDIGQLFDTPLLDTLSIRLDFRQLYTYLILVPIEDTIDGNFTWIKTLKPFVGAPRLTYINIISDGYALKDEYVLVNKVKGRAAICRSWFEAEKQGCGVGPGNRNALRIVFSFLRNGL